ncbi:hypothetical protein RvY_10417 [Ramazzottius varieornatus]|uniref:tRNA (adenine(58)-N(1))-methyltransferase catalytic subunit TRMT61A n=1 Tax=Ramazzottius varieornatus TaxID=947166 RepID=A0A1D1VI16_RAMVA|nr:hypothetical protein RvY_10417 [Ramazzottius varieornatus]
MSFFNQNRKDTVAAGDVIIVYIDFTTMLAVHVDLSAGKTAIHTKYGAIPFQSIIGHRYGTKFRCKNGYVQLLQPTPELWTKTMPFRTQILYLPDISMILMQLDLKPGSVVGESGTGSGSLSHAIARTVAPHGHLFTFDYHELRVLQFQKEINSHGLASVVTAQHSDVYKDGYGTLDGVLDAILLDLPCPWFAVPHAKKALKKSGGRLGSFSPCIEQVQRTCKELKAHGFKDIVTLECLMRPLEVKTLTMNCWIPTQAEANTDERRDNKLKTPFSQVSFPTAIVPWEVPGHSGFLTFASFYS